MKHDGEPMSLADLERLLIEASKKCNHRRFVVAGSLCAIGAVIVPPPSMVMSRDLDFYPQLDPDRGFLEIASDLGEGSTFHREHGYYADPITPKLLALPEGWESRLAPISLNGGVVAIFMDPNDAAIGKLARGQDNDLRWIAAGLEEGILQREQIIERLGKVSSLSLDEAQFAKKSLDSILSERPPGLRNRPEN